MIRTLLAVTAIAAAGLTVAGCGTASPGATGTAGKVTSSTSTAAPAAHTSATSGIPHAEDIKITGCANGSLGGPTATVVITNHSSKASNYIVTIAFDSPDGKTQLGTGNAAVNDLQPGQSSAPQTADSLSTTPGPAGFTCRLSDLTRYAS